VARQPYNLSDTRAEHDTLGGRHVPREALYGIHTVRAQENFNLGGDTLSDRPALIVALAQVKASATRANRELGVVEPHIAEAIIEAAREVGRGRHHEQFPLELVQGGGGTSTHMNVNEVLANRANELLGGGLGEYAPVHPNDHVNRSQSTNDVLPTAMGLAVYVTCQKTHDGLAHLQGELVRRALENDGLEHLGRTCLQDAVPVPVRAVHEAQAYAISRSLADLDASARQLLSVPLGATAVGTGLGTPDGFAALAVDYLAEETGLDVRPADDPFAALASLEQFAAVADSMSRAGRVVARIASDLRLLASGPVGGIGEVSLPPLQPGSSMMPGKVNPVLPELVMQVSYQLAGAAHVVRLSAGAGELEVNTMGPVVTAELLRGLERLGRVAVLFADRCVGGMQWQTERVTANLRGSLKLAVESVELVGYEAVAMGSLESVSSGSSARTRDSIPSLEVEQL
jgi:aspartate ammonia-lyase